MLEEGVFSEAVSGGGLGRWCLPRCSQGNLTHPIPASQMASIWSSFLLQHLLLGLLPVLLLHWLACEDVEDTRHSPAAASLHRSLGGCSAWSGPGWWGVAQGRGLALGGGVWHRGMACPWVVGCGTEVWPGPGWWGVAQGRGLALGGGVWHRGIGGLFCGPEVE